MVKKRILHLITRLPIGGAEYLLASIVRHLDPDYFESLVCCIQDRGELADVIEASGVRVVALGRHSKQFSLEIVLALLRLIREQNIDLVHCHLYHANLYGRVAAWFAGVPAIATVHNTYTRQKWHRARINQILGKRSLIIAVSSEAKADVIKHDHIDPSRVLLLPNGIDPDRVKTTLTKAEAKIRLGYSDDDFVIGCIGRLEEQKGHINLINAVRVLLDSTNEPLAKRMRVVIVGEGRLRNRLQEAVSSAGLDSHVQLAGPRSDIAEILRSLDLYVMPSLWEGLSLAMLEAMAAGLPVIISDVGGASEVLGENEFGIRVRPGSVDSLVEAIKTMAYSSSYRISLGVAARERVLTSYTLQDRVKRLEATYAELLSTYRRAYDSRHLGQ